MTAFLATYRANQRRSSIGKRTVVPNVSLGGGSSGGNAIVGAVTGVLGFAKTWLIDRIIGGGLTALWGFIVSTVITVRNFNWRQTDAEIDAQIGNARTALMGMLGGTLGNALGWFACGVVPGVVITKFNPAMGALVLKEIGEEALDEFIGNLSAMARYSVQALIRASIYNSFKAGRKWLFTNPTPLKRRLAEFVGINYDSERDLYLSQKGGNWSFAQRDQDRIDSIQDPGWQNFVEEFYEEMGEACIEAGFVVASSVESYLAASRIENQNILGAEQGVEVQPDRTQDEKFILVGPQEMVKQQIIQTLTQHQFIGNRDVGFITGESELQSNVVTSRKTLVIHWRNYEKPPWRRNYSTGEQDIRSEVKIDNLKPAISWQELKQAVRRFTTGDVRVTAFLTSGRQMGIFASTEEEGIDKLEQLAELSTDEIIRTTSGKQKLRLVNRAPATGDRARGNIRPQVLMYPAYAYFITKIKWIEGSTNQKQPKQPNGYSSQSDAYYLKRERFDLYVDSKPNNYPTLL